MDWVQSIRL